MAYKATFAADFSQWDRAIENAKKGLSEMQLRTDTVQKRMQQMFSAFDGSKIKAEADIVAAAFEKVGRASKLTVEEQQRVNAVMTEAIAKYQRLGKEVPAAWRDIKAETDGASQKTQSFFRTLVSGVTVANLASQAITSLARNALQMGRDFLASADRIEDLSNKTGISIGALQKFEYAATQTGGSLDTLTNGIRAMQERLGSNDKAAIQAVKALGLSFEELRKQAPEDAFMSIVRALGAVEDQFAKAGIAGDVFGGRVSGEILQMLPQFDALVQRAEKLGLVIDEKTIRAASALGDAFETLGAQGKAALFNALAPLIPELGRLAEAAVQAAPKIGNALAEAFQAMADALVGIRIAGLEAQEVLLRTQAIFIQFASAAKSAIPGFSGSISTGGAGAVLLTEQADKLAKEIDRLVLERMAARVKVVDARLTQASGAVPAPLLYDPYAASKTAPKKSAAQEARDIAFAFGLTSLPGGFAYGKPSMTDVAAYAPIREVPFTYGLTSLPGFNLGKPSMADLGGAGGGGGLLGADFGGKLGQTILAAFTGGGNVGKSIGGLFGGQLVSGIGESVGKWAGSLTSGLGKTLGGALGSIIPGLGTLLGGAVGSLFGKLFGGESKQTKQMREQFLAQAGGIDEVRKMADYANFSLERLLSTKKTKTFEAEVKKLEAAFAAAQKRVQGLIDELGKLGQAGGLVSGDVAKRLLADFDKPEVQDAFKQFVTQNLDAAAKNMTAFLQASKDLPLTAKSAEALGAALGGVFQRLRELGTPLADALAALSPAIDALQARLEAAGLTGGAAFDALRNMAALAKDEIAGPLLSGVDSLTQAMVNLANSGLLTEEMFQGLAEQVGATWDKLIAEGKSGDDALRLMAPSLQRLWELQQKWGWAVDETTQALIDQAKEQGLVGENMKDVMSQVLDVLKAIAKVLGADIPEAARQAGEAISQIPEVPDPRRKYYDGGDDGLPAYARGGPVYLASGGWPRVGTDVIPAMLSPGEYVVSAPAVQRVGVSTLDALNAGQAVGGTTVNVAISIDTLDTQSVRQAVEQDIAPALVEVLRQNVRGLRTDTQYALGVRG